MYPDQIIEWLELVQGELEGIIEACTDPFVSDDLQKGQAAITKSLIWLKHQRKHPEENV